MAALKRVGVAVSGLLVPTFVLTPTKHDVHSKRFHGSKMVYPDAQQNSCPVHACRVCGKTFHELYNAEDDSLSVTKWAH